MANLHGDLPVEVRRILFVKKRMMERGAKDFAKSEEIVRKLAPVAVDAVQQFDRNEYASDWLKFVDSDQAVATQIAILMTSLQAGAEALKKRCDVKHERPKSCECAEMIDVLMARVPAVPELNGTLMDEIEGKDE